MSLLLETIRIENGKADNCEAHEKRVTHTQLNLEGIRRLPPIPEIFEDYPPPPTGLYKARLVYNRDLYKVEYLPYKKAKIEALRICRVHHLYYPYKFANRKVFEQIKSKLPINTEALIIVGDRVTDTCYTNVAFYRNNQWFTPAYPILPGTRRASLLDAGVILPKDIHDCDLPTFSRVKLFNAMIPWDEGIELSTEVIID